MLIKYKRWILVVVILIVDISFGLTSANIKRPASRQPNERNTPKWHKRGPYEFVPVRGRKEWLDYHQLKGVDADRYELSGSQLDAIKYGDCCSFKNTDLNDNDNLNKRDNNFFMPMRGRKLSPYFDRDQEFNDGYGNDKRSQFSAMRGKKLFSNAGQSTYEDMDNDKKGGSKFFGLRG